ncbi:MAG: SAM-dependent chlorinase/fluorinase [Bacteroidia bacterium]|nr:SAM-dependent chlorinase/fluorinase [Bacteroidia bacterium]
MPILTLTTDWGINDHYVGAFKGSILTGCADIKIVSISNTIEPFNTIKASFVLKNSYRNFPEGTIHFVGVMRYDNIKSNEIKEMKRVVIKCNGHFFIGSDSGIFSLVLGDSEMEIISLDDVTFQNETEKYVSAICHIANGKPFQDLGAKLDSMTHSYMLSPTIDSSMIRCTIIYIDSFGNGVTNLTRQQFEEGRTERKFTVFFPDNSHFVNSISKHYTDVVNGEAVALFNSAGYLEIAQNCSSAQKLMGIKIMDTVRIEFQ